MKTIYKNCFLLLAALLFLPTALKAQDAEPQPFGTAPDGVVLNKYVTDNPEDPNRYTINLEAFVTGQTIIKSASVPLDVVLVLDASGSMDETFVTNTFEQLESTSYSVLSALHVNLLSLVPTLVALQLMDLPTYYYYLYNGQYYRIYAANDGGTGVLSSDPICYLYFVADGKTFYLKGTGISETKYTVSSSTSDIYTGQLYAREQTTTKKMDALKLAAENFVKEIAADAEKTGVDHHVSVVKFASEYKRNNQYTEATSNDLSKNDYTQIVCNPTNKYDDVISKINQLQANGATYADYGMELASHIIDNINKDESRKDSYKAVVMLTDGQPNHDSGFTPKYANATINNSLKLKKNDSLSDAENQKRAFVYTIYVGASDDITVPKNPATVAESSNVTQLMWNYMNAVSSNYPYATGYVGKNLGKRAEGDYYFMVTSAEELNVVFTKIGAEVISGGANYELTETTEIRDIVSQSFMLPIGADADDIRLSVAKVKSIIKNKDGKITGYEFYDATPAPSSVKATVSGKRVVSVSGFNFADNYVGEDIQADGTLKLHEGYKLCIDFDIVIDPDAPGGADVPTNDPNSGIYIDDEPIATFGIPTVKIPNVVVVKKGLHKGESAIFTIQRVQSYRMDKNGNIIEPKFTDIKLVATCTEEGKDAIAVLKIQIPGRYRVIEDTWSWAYDLSSVQKDYGALDDTNIEPKVWAEHGFWYPDEEERPGDKGAGYWARMPWNNDLVGTAVSLSGRWIERNVNDFTENKTSLYVGTEFIFVNEEKANTPAHAEGQVNNEFYVRPMK